MISVLQRVVRAAVTVGGEQIAEIGLGLAVLVAVERNDGIAEARQMATRLLRIRVFGDASGRMNKNVGEVGGALLLIPQFTLAAETDSGHRPSFSRAAPPPRARELFDALVEHARLGAVPVLTGRFGAAMQVTLTNDGPVTFSLRLGAKPAS
jgi:D-tyrosyl-tRNA(Tyr) deacylase